MIQQTATAGFFPQRIETTTSRLEGMAQPELLTELLPFTLKMVKTEAELNKAVQIRHSAYARHLPTFAETLKQPEALDAEDGVVVLLAQSKEDGSPMGTFRIQTNEFKPLALEKSVELPGWLKSGRLAEGARLAVVEGKIGRLVTTALFKGIYLYCQEFGIEQIVVVGRSPMDRQHVRLLFEDVFPGMGYIPMSHVGNIPHRVMHFNVATAQDRWAAAQHPMLDFMCNTYHPDIKMAGQCTPTTRAVNMSTLQVAAPMM